MCGHFKTPPREKLLIELEKKKEKPTWKAYQGKQKEELIWETDNLTWTDNEQEKPSSWEWKEEKNKGKKREEENTQVNNTYISYTYEEFHEHYQNLALTREEQEQWLAQLNTRLCHHCLIPSDFEYCDDCDLIYNPPPCMIYSIPKEKEPISSCASESESLINHDPDSDDDNKNTSSSSIQNGNDNKDNSNSDLNYEQYIALPDLSKEQELKWYSDNGEGIMLERAHNTDAGFDLRYLGTEAIKLEPHTCICIDLKVALEILATTMV
ncbi:hypothetical protein G9A89_015700 [Geosiphon pyriformis]|nr:hypothetical protein G9A89_015700 [Geosiphon pyriformis]